MAKKVASNSPGLVKFAIRLVSSVTLAQRASEVFGELKTPIEKNCNLLILLIKICLGG